MNGVVRGDDVKWHGPGRMSRFRPSLFFHAAFFNRFAFFTRSQRALIARRAFAFRSAGVIFAAVARPPMAHVFGFVKGMTPVIHPFSIVGKYPHLRFLERKAKSDPTTASWIGDTHVADRRHPCRQDGTASLLC